MIENKTIICFASGYEAPPTSKHHVMHLLAGHDTVLWVNYHASRAPTASSSEVAYIAAKLRQVLGGLKKARRNLYVLTPLVVPLPGTRWARSLNRPLVVAQIRWALSKVRTGPVQIWSFAPDVSYLLGNFGEEKVVYYCVDDFAHFSGYDCDQILRDEADLAGKADLVVTTSTALQESKKHLNPRTILVPHGVDFEHFSKALSEEVHVPGDVAGVPHPVIGFFGLIRDWVDLDLVAGLARKRADWHFVFVGDADSTVDLSPYREINNMYFLGRRPYADMPAYCRCFDVGIIPFKINQLTRAVNPIKLREYLAAGLPVVSTPLPEVGLYKELIEIADDPRGFERALERCLKIDHKQRLRLSQRMAAEKWPKKVELICRYL